MKPDHLVTALICAFLVSASLFSCRTKEESPNRPLIEILKPAGGSKTIEVPDTFTVKGRIRSEDKIGMVEVELIDGNGIPVSNTETRTPDRKNVAFELSLQVNDERLKSGVYKVKVRAKTAQLSKKAFRRVTLLEAPLELKGLYAVTDPGGQTRTIHRYDADLSGEVLTSRKADLIGADASSYHQSILMAGSENGDLVARDPETGNEKWSVPNKTNPPFPYFTAVQNDPRENLIFVALSTGSIRGYRGGGSIGLVCELPEDHHAYIARSTGKYILTYQEQVNNNDKALGIYYSSTGSFKEKRAIDGKVVSILPKGKERVYLVMNRKGQGSFRKFGVTGNSIRELTGSPSGEYRDALLTEEGEVFLAHEKGIYRFLPSTNSLIAVNKDVSPSHLSLDRENSRVVAASGRAIAQFDMETGEQLRRRTLSDTVRALMVLNNK